MQRITFALISKGKINAQMLERFPDVVLTVHLKRASARGDEWIDSHGRTFRIDGEDIIPVNLKAAPMEVGG